MRRLCIAVFLAVFFLVCGGSPARAYWSDRFSAPQSIGPGSSVSSGPVLDTLTPELTFKKAGTVSYVYLFEEQSLLTLAEEVSQKRSPVFVSRSLFSALKIPAGVLKPGNRYYWYVKSIHNPGTRSECAKTSETLYFSTASDAK